MSERCPNEIRPAEIGSVIESAFENRAVQILQAVIVTRMVFGRVIGDRQNWIDGRQRLRLRDSTAKRKSTLERKQECDQRNATVHEPLLGKSEIVPRAVCSCIRWEASNSEKRNRRATEQRCRR